MPHKKRTDTNAIPSVPCIDRHYIGLNAQSISVFESAFSEFVRGYHEDGHLLFENRTALVAALSHRFEQTDFSCEVVNRIFHSKGVIDQERLFLSGRPFKEIWIYFEIVDDHITMFRYLHQQALPE
ncbi:hypothetical protein [Flavobacterium sp.]|uniref:hypothetical protein n=1 Tax=Flavobacterium sp. TaxID=239 RepID=UPI00262EC15C|nr:hypothetical protein [Flavobacterium sp.]